MFISVKGTNVSRTGFAHIPVQTIHIRLVILITAPLLITVRKFKVRPIGRQKSVKYELNFVIKKLKWLVASVDGAKSFTWQQFRSEIEGKKIKEKNDRVNRSIRPETPSAVKFNVSELLRLTKQEHLRSSIVQVVAGDQRLE